MAKRLYHDYEVASSQAEDAKLKLTVLADTRILPLAGGRVADLFLAGKVDDGVELFKTTLADRLEASYLPPPLPVKPDMHGTEEERREYARVNHHPVIAPLTPEQQDYWDDQSARAATLTPQFYFYQSAPAHGQASHIARADGTPPANARVDHLTGRGVPVYATPDYIDTNGSPGWNDLGPIELPHGIVAATPGVFEVIPVIEAEPPASVADGFTIDTEDPEFLETLARVRADNRAKQQEKAA
jgi:hypothetical protein